MSVRSASLALALFGAAPAVAEDTLSGADPGATADVTGNWSFSTVRYNLFCTMTGELTLETTDDPDVLSGQLTASEQCRQSVLEAVETSVAVRNGAQLSLTSTLVEVTPPDADYLADNFVLRIVNDSLMVGELRFGHVIAKAEFRRRNGLVS